MCALQHLGMIELTQSQIFSIIETYLFCNTAEVKGAIEADVSGLRVSFRQVGYSRQCSQSLMTMPEVGCWYQVMFLFGPRVSYDHNYDHPAMVTT